jgi:hypothetical protein
MAALTMTILPRFGEMEFAAVQLAQQLATV